jgi:hypothetical protein
MGQIAFLRLEFGPIVGDRESYTQTSLHIVNRSIATPPIYGMNFQITRGYRDEIIQDCNRNLTER